ncbi:MAG: pyridoxal phosphate-dependent aminotransferase [Lautropia sp.]
MDSTTNAHAARPAPAPALPALSNRVARIAPFEVMELVKRANRLQAQGRPIIHMSIGEPDFSAPEPVIRRLEEVARGGGHGYTPAVGIEALREAIAGHYQRHYGVAVDPRRIVVTAGASAALMLACEALVNPGDEVLLTDPSYPCNRHFVAAVDGVPKLVPVGPGTRFQMTPALLADNWSAATKGTLLATPANPTGTSIPFDALAGIVAETRARGGFAIVDEIYLDLSYGLAGDAAPARTALELGDDVIVTNSFSKYFNMTGWRLGWMVVPAGLTPVFEKLAQNLFICPSALAQQAALACFSPEAGEIYAQRKASFRARRDRFVPALKALGLDVPAYPDGAFYAWVDCSSTGMGSTAFADRLLEEADVCVVPGTDFGRHERDRYVRMSYATGVDQLDEAIERIGRFLHTR